MSYRIELSSDASKFLMTVPECDRKRIQRKIRTLSENPRDHGVIKLTGNKLGHYRIRQGDYRIIFTIKDDILLVEVIEIDNRKDVYK